MIMFFKRHLWIAILILALLLIPQSVNIQSELNMRVLMTTIGVDKNDDGKYNVSVAMVKPSRGSTGPSANARMEVVVGDGKTVADAVAKVSFLIGKTAGFSHVNTIILGNKLVTEDDAVEVLDYFIRDNRIPTSSMVMVAKDKAEDTLKDLNKLELSTAVDLQKLLLYKESSLNGIMMNILNFVDDYYQPSKCSLLSEIKMVDEKEQSGSGGESGGSEGAGSGQGSESGSSGESGSGDSGTPKIEYNNVIYLFNKGRLAGKLEDEKTLIGVNLANPKSDNGMIVVENVNDKVYDNADVSLYIRDKKVRYKTKFVDGVPQITMYITTKKNEVFEIKNKDGEELKNLYTQKTYLTKTLVNMAEQYIADCVMQAFNEAKDMNVDVLDLGTRLYRKDHKKWKEFSEGLSQTEYLNKIQFNIVVKLKNQL